MAGQIKRYHWVLEKPEYLEGINQSKFKTSWPTNLSLQPLEPGTTTSAFFLPLLSRIPWGWEKKDINKDPALSERLAKPGTQLVLLKDDSRTIGFALLSDPNPSLMQRLGYAEKGKKIKEIEDLALFPEEAGYGRGTAYFEMFFKLLFKDHDAVYWSQASTNHPHLYAYYSRMGMKHIGTTEEPDFIMRETIHHNHFSLSRRTYKERLSIGFYRASFPENFHIKELSPVTLDLLLSKIARVDKNLHWDKQPKLKDKEAFVKNYLQTPETHLFALMDGDKEVGFSMIKSVSDKNRARFFSTGEKGFLSQLCNRLFGPKVIEIDYLALYEGEEGHGRGRLYFEMFFSELFKNYDTIYWSQFTSNAPTLERFYREKMGMTLLAKDEVPDFRAG